MMRALIKTTALVWAVFLSGLMLAGCSAVTDPGPGAQGPVNAILPVSIGDRAFVQPHTMALALTSGGMSPQQAIGYGPHIMELIIDHGGAEVYVAGQLSYIVSVFGDSLYVSSLEHGLSVFENDA